MEESAFAILCHTVPVEISRDTECTSTALFSVFGTSSFPCVLIMCAKCDAHATDREVGIAAVRCRCDVNALMICFIEHNEADIRMA